MCDISRKNNSTTLERLKKLEFGNVATKTLCFETTGLSPCLLNTVAILCVTRIRKRECEKSVLKSKIIINLHWNCDV